MRAARFQSSGDTKLTNSPLRQDGLARLCPPPLRLDKLVHLVGFEAKDATKLPLLEKGVQAIGMLLAVAEGANPICIPNDQGSIAVGHAPGSGSQHRYYCQQKIRGQKGICAADNRGQQCKWCSKLQHQADFTILPLQEEHVVDIRENQMSMTDCGQALIKVMNAQLSSTRIQAWACTGIGILASQGNEGQSRELLQAVTRAIAEHKWQEPVLLCALRALNKLLDVLADKGFGAAAAADTDCPVDYSSPKFIMEQVTDVLIVHRRNVELQILCFKCLYSIASEHPKEIAAGWGLEAIIRALREYCSPHSGTSSSFSSSQSLPLLLPVSLFAPPLTSSGLCLSIRFQLGATQAGSCFPSETLLRRRDLCASSRSRCLPGNCEFPRDVPR